eukprot:scaffold15166_cov70-Phaeocystis_antarctica.AAC.1
MPCALSSASQPVSSSILFISAPSAASPCSTSSTSSAELDTSAGCRPRRTGASRSLERAAGSRAVGWSNADALGKVNASSPSFSSTCAAIARGVGCSNTSAGESASPVAACNRLDSSVAASMLIPASISGVLAVTLASASPVSSRTARSTSDSTCGCRCVAGSAASVSASSRDAGPASSGSTHASASLAAPASPSPPAASAAA